MAFTRQLLQGQRAALLERLDSTEVDSTQVGAEPPGVDADQGCFDEDNVRGVKLGHARVDSIARARLVRLGGMRCRDAVQEVARTFVGYVPTVMFVLLPLFALVLKLLYVRQGRFYAEHMIFLLHTHAFVFAIFTILLVREWLFGWAGAVLGWTGLAPTIVALLLGWALVYIYLAMRRVYAQGWLKTLLKYWTLGWAYFWVLVISVPFLLVATLLLLPA
jgi:hypothetical protein